MKATEFLQSVHNLKCRVLNEIRKVLPKGIHYYKEPFYIHYVEGEVAITKICRAIEVSDEQMVKIHQQSDEDCALVLYKDTDIIDGEAIFCYEPKSFADILDNLTKDIRNEKLCKLRNIVKKHRGKMMFDGNFRYVGYDTMNCMGECEDTMLMGFELDDDGTLIVYNIWQGGEYCNSEGCLTNAELDRIIEYVRNQSVRKFEIKVVASRVIEVQAASYDEAVELAKKELADNPLTDADIDCWM